MVKKAAALLIVFLLLAGGGTAWAGGGQADSGRPPGSVFFDTFMCIRGSQVELAAGRMEKALMQSDLADKLVDTIAEENADPGFLEELIFALENTEAALMETLAGAEAGFTHGVDSVEFSEDEGYLLEGWVNLRYAGPEQVVRVLVSAAVPEGADYTLEGRDGDVWYPISTHWGPAEGFPVEDGYDVTTPVRLVTDLPGDYIFTLEMMDEDDTVITSAVLEVDVSAGDETGMSAEFTYGVESEEFTVRKGYVVKGWVKLRYEGPEQVVRVLVSAAAPEDADYTLEGRDGDSWYPVSTHWGPLEGFPVEDGYDVTTPIRLLTDTPGHYTFTLMLVNSDDEVITSAEAVIEVDLFGGIINDGDTRGRRLQEIVQDETMPIGAREGALKALRNQARTYEKWAWGKSGQKGPPPWSNARINRTNADGDENSSENGDADCDEQDYGNNKDKGKVKKNKGKDHPGRGRGLDPNFIPPGQLKKMNK